VVQIKWTLCWPDVNRGSHLGAVSHCLCWWWYFSHLFARTAKLHMKTTQTKVVCWYICVLLIYLRVRVVIASNLLNLVAAAMSENTFLVIELWMLGTVLVMSLYSHRLSNVLWRDYAVLTYCVRSAFCLTLFVLRWHVSGLMALCFFIKCMYVCIPNFLCKALTWQQQQWRPRSLSGLCVRVLRLQSRLSSLA